LTGELGVAIAPRLAEAILEKLELVALSSEKVLLVLTLGSGVVRTVYIDLPLRVPPETLVSMAVALSERLAGQTLTEIRQTLADRLRDVAGADSPPMNELINIFVQSADDLFEWRDLGPDSVHLGRASLLADQP